MLVIINGTWHKHQWSIQILNPKCILHEVAMVTFEDQSSLTLIGTPSLMKITSKYCITLLKALWGLLKILGSILAKSSEIRMYIYAPLFYLTSLVTHESICIQDHFHLRKWNSVAENLCMYPPKIAQSLPQNSKFSTRKRGLQPPSPPLCLIYAFAWIASLIPALHMDQISTLSTNQN